MDIWEIDKLLLFIAFIIPGFVAIKFYGLLHPNDKLDSSKQVIDSLAYSCVCYALVGIPIIELREHIEKLDFWLLWLLVFGVLLVLPCMLALAFSKVRQLEVFQRNAPHPIQKPWDFVFQQRKCYWVIVELTDGKRIGGKFAGDSFASSYPAAEQIYLEECWHIDNEDTFIRPRGGTLGILTGSSKIKTIEFFEYDTGEKTDDSESTGSTD
ncbi:hypothetical protein P0F25_003323 [Vibrio metschnikovii]|nr:hypothetical protein [Vibrio metschnikovii]